ncbi:MAG: MYXO-CTERM sorting domain-containing protein [Deltaproteobacteria bacterium]|nr:MYXO-CTERM sorting domain-containing protein [Deltaproteobacteria bacterium]MDQ3296390.1 MYXO-CTERM sorting domain-containing protein [Myxococcota bacterium]
MHALSRLACLLVLPTALLAAAPREAAASGCYLGPFAMYQAALPVNCPAIVYDEAGYTYEPKLFVIRDGVEIDVTGAITRVEVQVDVENYQSACDGSKIDPYFTPAPYTRFEVSLENVVEGDRVLVNFGHGGSQAGVVTAAGPCTPPPPPAPFCTSVPGPCDYPYDDNDDDDDDCGCQAGGNPSGFAVGLLGLALLIRRRRRQV